jgi:hypothetical protein
VTGTADQRPAHGIVGAGSGSVTAGGRMDRTVMASGARGVVAAMAMTGLRRMTKAVGLVAEAPPDELARRGTGTAGLMARVPASFRDPALELAHWTVGGVGGAVFGAVVAPRTRHVAVGPVYGLAIWAAFEAVAVPLLGLEESRARPLRERAAIAADHVLYGLIVAPRTPPR